MNGEGGSYLIKKPGGKPELVERTVDQPDGNRPRAADGTPQDVVPAPAEPATEESKGTPRTATAEE